MTHWIVVVCGITTRFFYGITMENPLKGLSNQGLLGGFGLSGWFDWFD
jgi:hypothetical protein